MEQYLGVKLIKAEPMARKKESSHILIDTGYEAGYKVVYPDGYESWSPKAAFEEAYRKIDNLTFGLAVEAVKKGFKIARNGWNGKGMFVYYVAGGEYATQMEAAKKEFGKSCIYNPYLAIKNVNGTVSTWVPSINDVLAEDWKIVE